MTPSDSASPSRLARLRHFLLRPHVLLLLFLAVVIAKGIYPDEFHYFGDEMRHGMTGVFFRDLMVDRPFAQPVKYAYEYYAKYPALGVPHWPPLYYTVEGTFFLLLGINVVASRLTTLAYALVGIYCWYRIAERQGSRTLALLSALIFPLLPYVLIYERATMLEIPQVSMCLLTIFLWLRFLDTEKGIYLWVTAAAAAAAMLTSQKSIFLVFFLPLHFLSEGRFRLLRRWDLWAAGAASVAAVAPWYLFSVGNLALSYERAIGDSMSFLKKAWNFYFYPQMVPEQLGFLLSALAAAGLAMALFCRPRQNRLMLVWVFSAYVCFTVIQEKDLRHTMVWVPPLVYFALLALDVLFVRPPWTIMARTALVAWVLFVGLRFDRPRMTGLDEVAEYVLSQPESDIVFYQGNLNGDFIFYVRQHDPQKSHMVARDKQVVATRVMSIFGSRVVLKSPQEVIDLFRTWGIRYVVIEATDYLDSLGVTRAALESGHFELIRKFELWKNQRDDIRDRIMVYRFKGELQRTSEPVSIPMMTLRADIKADLNRLAGRPWPN